MAPLTTLRHETAPPSMSTPTAPCARLLLAMPEGAACAELCTYLRCYGMAVQWVATAADLARQLPSLLGAGGVDLVLLGLGAGNAEALAALSRRRPVVWLGACAEPGERVLALEGGADACLPSPYVPRELVARIEAVLRRARRGALIASLPVPSVGAAHGIDFGAWRLDLATRRLLAPTGLVVTLSNAEFCLLRAFLSQPRSVLTRDELMNQARGQGTEAFERSIDLLVSRLRAKLESDPRQPRYIRTVRGVGYLFEVFQA